VKPTLYKLAQEIRDELEQLERSVLRSEEGWLRFQQTLDDFYLDSVALSLHNFYSGLERVFERIARTIDGTLPQGSNWHQLLLQQMANEIPLSRPAVISNSNREALEEFRGLRHVVRNVYAFQIDATKLKPLVETVSGVLARINLELIAFAAFLEEQESKK
jgi:hypothetical protein